MKRGRIVLIHMPIANPILPNLAIERLAAILRQANYYVDTLYGTLRFFPEIPLWLQNDSLAPILFASHYYIETQDDWVNMACDQVKKTLGLTDLPEMYRHTIEMGSYSAKQCIENCMIEIKEKSYDLVGFSIGFDAQRLPSAALAAAIKAEFPTTKIIAGGSACDSEMAVALKEIFPCFDRVVSGEAEDLIEILVDELLGHRSHKNMGPGDGEYKFTQNLEGLPFPDYTSFFEQAKHSGYADVVSALRVVLYEGSRGCWYGAKNHCTFCGIHAVDFPYRTVNPAQFLADVLKLQSQFDARLIYLTDAILSREMFTTVLPSVKKFISENGIFANFFAETKSNLSVSEIATLKCANVKVIQPGIESFLTSSLKRMKKGATGIQQIELLKWCKAFGIRPVYGLLIGVPGETGQDQFDLSDICESLHHLPPPEDCNRLSLHRFSPYFENPTSFGIESIRPFDWQKLLYRCSDEMLMRLCYEFDYSLNSCEDMPTPTSQFAVYRAVESWRTVFSSSHMRYWEDGDTSVVIQENDSGLKIRTFTGIDAQVLRSCHSARSFAGLIRHLAPSKEDDILSITRQLIDDGLLMWGDDRILNLSVPSNPDAYVKRSFMIASEVNG